MARFHMGDTSNMGDHVGMARFPHGGDMRDSSNMGDQVGMVKFLHGGHEGHFKHG